MQTNLTIGDDLQAKLARIRSAAQVEVCDGPHGIDFSLNNSTEGVSLTLDEVLYAFCDSFAARSVKRQYV